MKTLSILRNATLIVATLVAPLCAQLPDWVTRPSSSPSLLFAEATIVVVRDAGGIHAYSSLTRDWTTLQVGANAIFEGHDDHCIVIDSNTVWGYSTRTGVFTPVTTTGGVISVGQSGALWMSAIVDGTDCHVYSALLGTWTTVHFQSTPIPTVARLCTVISDGQKTVAIGAHFGDVVELTVPGITSTDAVGLCGIARTNDAIYAYSAYRNSWRPLAGGASAQIVKPGSRAGYFVIQDGGMMRFYSAMCDREAAVFVTSPTAVLQTGENVASILDGNVLVAYSATSSALDSVVLSNPSAIETKRFLVAAADANGAHAFGCVAGRFAAVNGSALTLQADKGAALAVPPSGSGIAPSAFSFLTNRWVAAPTSTYQYTGVTWCSAILGDFNGGTLYGFSPRTEDWAQIAAPAPDTVFQSHAMFCARSGLRLDVFNGRTGEWDTTTTSAPTTSVTTFDQAVMALDGQNAYLYDLYSAEWSSHAVSNVAGQELRDECAWIYDGSDVHVWSGSCQITEVSNAPEYWRVLSRGSRLAYHIAGEPGALAGVILGFVQVSQPTPFGTLLVDPQSAALLTLPPLPAVGTATLSVTVPDDPTLAGVTLHAQAVIVPSGGLPYLTQSYPATIM